MSAALAQHPALNWLRRHPGAILFTVFAVLQGIPFLLRHDSEWEEVYVASARRLVAGENIYDGRDSYLYPPFAAWCALPFTWLGALPARLAWYGVNLAALACLCGCAWRLAGGGALPRTWDREAWVWLFGLLCGFRYVLDGLAHQQTDVVIGGLLLAGCLALARGRALTAATALGLAAAVKCTALLWVPYLLWRGQWKAAVWLVAVAVGANLLPNLASTPADGGFWLEKWYTTYLRPMQNADHYPGIWGSAIYYNQSFAGLSYRLAVARPEWRDGNLEAIERPDAPTPTVMRRAVLAVQVALLLAAVLAVGRPRWSLPGGRRVALESGLVLTLMLLLSPMSSKPHFCTLLLPAWCLARLALVHRRRWAGFLVAAATLLGAVAMRDVCGFQLSVTALWWGSVMGSAAVLAVGCAIALCSRGETETPAGDPAGVMAE
jgi:hypothetical protein